MLDSMDEKSSAIDIGGIFETKDKSAAIRFFARLILPVESIDVETPESCGDEDGLADLIEESDMPFITLVLLAEIAEITPETTISHVTREEMNLLFMVSKKGFSDNIIAIIVRAQHIASCSSCKKIFKRGRKNTEALQLFGSRSLQRLYRMVIPKGLIGDNIGNSDDTTKH